jgi:hypothetical protein
MKRLILFLHLGSITLLSFMTCAQNIKHSGIVISCGGGFSLPPGTSYNSFVVFGETCVGNIVTSIPYIGSVGFLNATDINIGMDDLFINQTDIIIFPNPTDGIINIKSESVDISKIKIFSILGLIYYECTFKKTIDISNLTAGLYFIQLIDVNRNIVSIKKFVKQ